ncbi:hypothetical protein SO802_033684 [Lithocarpus litseifolius]|uniref:Peptidase A1 domain-containing protein n=1 Tax=Lithocarpus litseifolius TaxID=425828 RepID=A0AAW2BDT9_9ROSI
MCYVAKDVEITNVGQAVPTVDLVVEGHDDVVWRICGSNSMVRITTKDDDVWCLGIRDGEALGTYELPAIIIGGYQLKDNLLQFDLESNRLGFSSSLLLQGTTCANFTFTSDTTVTNAETILPHSNNWRASKAKYCFVSLLFFLIFLSTLSI